MFWQPNPWRVAPGPRVLQAGCPLRPFLGGDISRAAAAAEWELGGKCSLYGAPGRQDKVWGIREIMGPCSRCLVWDDPQPGCAMWCLSALEKVPSFPPDSVFSQMELSLLLWRFSRV